MYLYLSIYLSIYIYIYCKFGRQISVRFAHRQRFWTLSDPLEMGWTNHRAQKASWNQQPDFSHFDMGMGQNWIDSKNWIETDYGTSLFYSWVNPLFQWPFSSSQTVSLPESPVVPVWNGTHPHILIIDIPHISEVFPKDTRPGKHRV